MSDAPMGPGWWIADDHRWYPPELRPVEQDVEHRTAATAGRNLMAYLALVVLVAVAIAAAINAYDWSGVDERFWL